MAIANEFGWNVPQKGRYFEVMVDCSPAAPSAAMKPPHHFHSAGLHATDLHAVEVHAAELKMVGHKATEAKVSGPAVWERRRPMRPDSVSPHLIPLLRGRRATEAELAERASSEGVANFGDPDQARPAMGLAVGTTLSIALWAGIYFAVHWALV